jgi:membrane dipeptidase
VVQVIGIDHVGIGTDFDGGGGVDGCRNAAEVKNITIELLRRGYSGKEIEKIWSGNIMRVLRQVEAVAVKV